jgi:hypothetical protein
MNRRFAMLTAKLAGGRGRCHRPRGRVILNLHVECGTAAAARWALEPCSTR